MNSRRAPIHRVYIGNRRYAEDKHPVLTVIVTLVVCALIGVMLGLMAGNPAAW